MSGFRNRLSVGERCNLFMQVLKSFRDNYDCDEDAHKYGIDCRCCVASMALRDKDPWEKDKDTFHLDEFPAGKYIARVISYQHKTVIFQVVPIDTPVSFTEDPPFDETLSREAKTEMMPFINLSIQFPVGSILKIEILEPEGYKVLGQLR